ncbi:MAG: neutral/alkaline non-lysosomal ceramidase N-terminal domain-containing protein [Acidobacteriota bacterium]
MRLRAPSRRRCRVLWGTLLAMVVLVLALVGPWPTYGRSDIEHWPVFRRALADLEASLAESQRTAQPGRLQAGWQELPLEMPSAVPLAGYGDRQGQPSTGAREALDIGALVLSDGVDTVALVTADLLIVPQNIAGKVRAAVAEHLPLRPGSILFTASHTHSGPGGFSPGWLARLFAGSFDPRVEQRLVATMTTAIVRAWEDRASARLSRGRVAVPQHVANRARPGLAVDPDLHWLRVVKADGTSCTLASYAAHPTLIGADNMRLSAGYPGALERALEEPPGAVAMFLAGAVGSMEPVAPVAGDAFIQAEALGRSLAMAQVEALEGENEATHLDLAAAGIAFDMPPLQARLTRSWRLSPFLVRALGVDRQAWLQGLRIGDTVLVGTPSDFSGELSVELKAEAAGRGVDLWLLSFNGDYVGYISPDRYYDTAARNGPEGYEMYTMSWFGPQQGEYLTRLIERLVEGLSDD